MGAFDGAECSDLIGLYLLHLITTEVKDLEIGLYRDDGLCVSSATPRLTEKLRQKIVKIFKDNNLGITSTANLSQVQFLDVTLDLKNEIYKPYIKPGDKPTYVHSQSNHPPRIIKNIPLSIIKRLAKISANKAASPLYQAELTKSGYQHTLEFDPTATTNRRRTRTRKVLYFNPPYSKNVKTNIGAKFLRLIDHHFPPGSPLHPLINRKRVKLSYRCLPNLKTQIAKHNFKILNQEKIDPPPTCNCQDKPKCPLPGKCTIQSLVYRATVAATGTSSEEKYVGLTANTFKQRFGGHKQNFSKSDDRTKSTLAGHIWNLNENRK